MKIPERDHHLIVRWATPILDIEQDLNARKSDHPLVMRLRAMISQCQYMFAEAVRRECGMNGLDAAMRFQAAATPVDPMHIGATIVVTMTVPEQVAEHMHTLVGQTMLQCANMFRECFQHCYANDIHNQDT
jgi:hypothetical protein